MVSKTQIKIGCQVHTFDKWKEKYMEIAQRFDAVALIREYMMYFNLAITLYGDGKIIEVPEI